MSNMKRSKKVSQDDLRRLMAQHKGKTAVASKIDNPLAKYNDSGQLTCALCKSVVRSESVWPVHINSRQHRDSVAEAKRLKELTNNFTSVAKAPKRPASPPTRSTEQKKIKGILKNVAPKGVPDDFFQKPKPPPPQNAAPSIVMSHNEEIKRAPLKPLPPKTKEVQQESQPPTLEEESKTAAPAAPQAADQPIPEGFFDDPVLDAKARNIEYKDPIEEEWERFQKEMRSETSASAEMIAGEQEEATAERQIDEIDEQIRNWSRVLDLELKKEETAKIKQEHGDTGAEADGDASGSDADIDEFLDWRAKKSYS